MALSQKRSVEPTLNTVRKFGDVMAGGFCPVPNYLITQQDKFGLNTTEMVILLNLMMHWYEPNKDVFPATDTLAKRIGLSRRAIQLGLKSLVEKGFIEELKNMRAYTIENKQIKASGARHYSLNPLKIKLEDAYRQHKKYRAELQQMQDG